MFFLLVYGFAAFLLIILSKFYRLSLELKLFKGFNVVLLHFTSVKKSRNYCSVNKNINILYKLNFQNFGVTAALLGSRAANYI